MVRPPSLVPVPASLAETKTFEPPDGVPAPNASLPRSLRFDDAFERVREDLGNHPLRLDFKVSAREAQDAFTSLLSLQNPQELGTLLNGLAPRELNRLIASLAALSHGDGASPTQAPLVRLLEQMAEQLPPNSGEWVSRLETKERQRLQESLLLLPRGELLAGLRKGLGEKSFELLVRGDGRATNIGHELLAGEYFGANVTDPMLQRYHAAQAGTLPPPANVNDFTYVIGPGLFGVNLPGYLKVNERALLKMGVSPDNIVRMDDAEFNAEREHDGKVPFNTAGSSADNAEAVRDRILFLRSQGKKVVLFGHSKFGSDLREMFGAHPELAKEVAGVVLMQPAPSAQIAPDLQKHLKPLLDTALKLVGGNEASFGSLSKPSPNATKPWPGAQVPTVVFASTTESPAALLSPLARLYYGNTYGAPSDGAVPFVNQAGFAGAALAAVPGMADHSHAGLTFPDAAEHFAAQLDAGKLDPTMTRLVHEVQTDDTFALLRPFISGAERVLTPEHRAQLAEALRRVGAKAETFSQGLNKAVGYPLLDAEALTQSLVGTLLEQMPAS